MSNPETTEGVGEINNGLGSNTTNAATVRDGSSGLSPELLAMNPLMLQRFEQFLRDTAASVTPVSSIDDAGAVSVASLSTITDRSFRSSLSEEEQMQWLYGTSGPSETFNDWTMKTIKDYLGDKIFPYIKVWNDPVQVFDIPDFQSNIKSDDKKAQARIICERLLEFLNRTEGVTDGFEKMKMKVMFWKTYRTRIRRELVEYRCVVTNQVKNTYVSGELRRS
tara:strand:+ start:122 stop:787 length:666 start_codon:yes stop_codon:yes gene_type:complete